MYRAAQSVEIVSLEFLNSENNYFYSIQGSPPVTTTQLPEPKNKTCESTDTKLISSEEITSLESVPTWEQCANLCTSIDTCSHWNFYDNLGKKKHFTLYD